MPAAHPIVANLVALDTLKTWSLIVTLFGDLDGTSLTGRDIRMLLSHIGIKPEAIRVALHRLKEDGWITATKQGREAVYAMSDMARAETLGVAPEIYRQGRTYERDWCFFLFQTGAVPPEAVLLNKNLAIAPAAAGRSIAGALSLTPDAVELPGWVGATLVSEGLIQLAGRLDGLVAGYSKLKDDLDRLAFRLLMLHHWRRIALRKGSWAHASLLPDGPIARCHVAVTRFLAETDRIKGPL